VLWCLVMARHSREPDRMMLRCDECVRLAPVRGEVAFAKLWTKRSVNVCLFKNAGSGFTLTLSVK